MKTCPSEQSWFDDLAGENAEADRLARARHLQHCPDCRDTVNRLQQRQALVQRHFNALQPPDTPYRLWTPPVKTALPKRKNRLALAGTAFCLLLALWVAQPFDVRCGDASSNNHDRFVLYPTDCNSDALEDWHEKRIAITVVEPGANQMRTCLPSFPSQQKTQRTAPVKTRGL